MKKILIALAGIALLVAGCAKVDRYIEQKPYRIIVDYLPQTVSIPNLSGTVTPVDNYDWITSNGNGSFTLRRNTTGLIRRAEFTIAGSSDKAVVNQKAHGLDAKVSSSLMRKDGDAKTADMKVGISTSFADDYESWGYIFGESQDMGANKDFPQGKFSTDDKTVTLTGVDPEKNYYFWSYVVSTEGDKIYSPVFGIAKPVQVRAGEDLQAAIDGAQEFAEVRVEAGATFSGTIKLRDNVTLSGGWNSSFDKQDLAHRSIIDGGGKKVSVESKTNATNAKINGFEIVNGTPNIVFNGTLTVEFCRVAFGFNGGQGGGIACTEQPGDNLVLANSIVEYNKADAHGGGIAINGAGTSVKVINCLFRGNASIAQYGYTGAMHGQAGVQAYVVNTTFVENVNWRDGSGPNDTPWSAVMFRNSGTHIEFVNNIVAGNWYFLPGVASDGEAHPDRYDMPIKPEYLLEMQVRVADFNEIGGSDANYVVQSNVMGGTSSSNFIHRAGSDAARAAAQAACTFVHNDDFNTIFVDAAHGDFHPAGPALTTGENSAKVSDLLGTYTTDLDGKPRVTGGKINAGCYQAQ